ncbi:MAG TPA: adenylosuccinate synthase [Candidatus Norongarragalinales archaeon]|nr:adenylosuccinate synthase [Candidatus Norongarragalinales archaeon]
MSSTVIIGAQWGDEGKGKIVDYYSDRFDLVVRYQGGNNAGHTVVVGEKKFKIQLIPSGIIRYRRSLIASGVVVDPMVLKKEIELFEKNGIRIDPSVLGVDFRAHVIMPWHRYLDAAREKGHHKIGTTGRGIGPVYESKAWRWGLRFEDLVDPESLKLELEKSYPVYEKILSEVYGFRELPSEKDILNEYAPLGEQLQRYLCDASEEIHAAIQSGQNVLFEGAQGMLLDNNFGTYPYVTSSQPIAANAAASAGVAPQVITSVEAVVKAYSTRVGEGPFPTELFGKEADDLRQRGFEFGTNTGRPRRIGWLDLTVIRLGQRLNGYRGMHVTKLDVLSGMPKVKVCTHYEYEGKQMVSFPLQRKVQEKSEPIYATLSGIEVTDWKEVVKKGKKAGFDALPPQAKKYVEFIEKESGVPVLTVSVGPARDQIILRREKK